MNIASFSSCTTKTLLAFDDHLDSLQPGGNRRFVFLRAPIKGNTYLFRAAYNLSSYSYLCYRGNPLIPIIEIVAIRLNESIHLRRKWHVDGKSGKLAPVNAISNVIFGGVRSMLRPS